MAGESVIQSRWPKTSKRTSFAISAATELRAHSSKFVSMKRTVISASLNCTKEKKFRFLCGKPHGVFLKLGVAA